MSSESAPPPAYENEAVLRVDTGPVAAPLLARVVAMMLARADCPIDKLDDAMLICDAIGAHAPPHSVDGHIKFTISTSAAGLELRVGDLASDGAQRLLQAAVLPGIGNVLEPIVDALRIEPSADERSEELVLELGFGPTLAYDKRTSAPRS